MTTVPSLAANPTTPASTASAATSGKPGAKGGTGGAADAFAALLQALAGGADAAPVLPAAEAGLDGPAEAGEATATAAEPAAPQAAGAALPLVVPFIPAAALPPRLVAGHAAGPSPSGDGKATATAAAATPAAAAHGKGDAPAPGQDAVLAADPAPAPRHGATVDLPAVAAHAAPHAAADGEPRQAARWSEVALTQGLHAAGTQPAAAPAPDAPTVPVHQAALPSHPLDRAFAGDVAAEVKLMADNGLQRAELHLNPADLGPLRIELTVSAQTADIQFAAAHATTREGIEQALPALRELLAGQGLQLGQAGVGSGGTGQQAFAWQAAGEAAQRHAAGARTGDASAAGGGLAAAPATVLVRRNQGMLDLYA